MRQLIGTFLISLICLLAAEPTNATQTLISPAPQANMINVLGTQVLGKINTVFQTSQGIIWLGTDEGLIRFDGYNAKRYVHHASDLQSLSHNQVTAIIEDSQRNLWIATHGGGLNKFSPRNEVFIRINLRLNNVDRTFTQNLSSLALTNDDLLWIASDKGIKQLNLTSELVVSLNRPLIDLNDKAISQIMVDQQQRLWLTTADSGVYRYHKQKLNHYPAFAKQQPGDSKYPIFEDQQQNIWLGTNNGLYRFESDNNRFVSTTTAVQNQPINDIVDDHHGNLWLGTSSGGVQRYSPATQQLTNINGQIDIYRKFDRDSIYHIMTDQQGSMWFATEQGLILVNQQALNINYLSNEKGSLLVSDIEQFNPQNIAFAGDHQYYQYNTANQIISAHMIDDNRVYRMSADSKGDLWLATLGQGLQRYSPKTGELQQIPHIALPDHPAGVSQLFDAFVDQQDKVWLLPFPDLPNLAGGVIAYHPHDQQFENYLTQPFIKDIIRLDDDHLLLSSDTTGLLSLHTQSKMTGSWKQTTKSAPRRNFNLFKDSNNTLWIGTAEQRIGTLQPTTAKLRIHHD